MTPAACAFVLWIFVGTMPSGAIGGWGQKEVYETLRECKVQERYVNDRIQRGEVDRLVRALCLPAGQEPR